MDNEKENKEYECGLENHALFQVRRKSTGELIAEFNSYAEAYSFCEDVEPDFDRLYYIVLDNE